MGGFGRTGDENTVHPRGPIAGGGYGRESGTSESVPFVSAHAGLLASEGKTVGGIRKHMQDTATDLGPADIGPYYGHGRIDANRAVP